MTTKKNGKQLKMHRTPPQPRRKSLFQTAGEVSKPFLITIITFIAILALLVLLLFSKQFVGRALYTGLENSAGLVLVGKAVEGEAFKAVVKANIKESKTSTIGFKLDLPPMLTCGLIEIKNLLPSPLLEIIKCEPAPGLGDRIVYAYTTLGSPQTGEFEIAEISFKPLGAGSYDLKFSQFEIIDGQNKILSLNVLNPTLEVKKKVEQPPQCPPGKECCGGAILVDLQTDKTNCGSCGEICEGLQSCVAGKCVAQCTGETPDICGGSCVNLQKDSLNCGQCNKACVEPNVCLKGICSEKKEVIAQPPAPGECVSDDDCGDGYECTAGKCVKKEAAQLPVTPSCVLASDCGSGYECKDGVCTLKEAAAQPGVQPPSLQQCASNSDCAANQECKSGVCQEKSAAQLPGAETIQGKKVTLTEITPANNLFSTQITATEDFASEVLVYTVLYGADNKVLSLQTEKIVAGLKKGTTYTATVNYPQSKVKKKTVLLYDVEANPQVHALLEKTYAVS